MLCRARVLLGGDPYLALRCFRLQSLRTAERTFWTLPFHLGGYRIDPQSRVDRDHAEVVGPGKDRCDHDHRERRTPCRGRSGGRREGPLRRDRAAGAELPHHQTDAVDRVGVEPGRFGRNRDRFVAVPHVAAFDAGALRRADEAPAGVVGGPLGSTVPFNVVLLDAISVVAATLGAGWVRVSSIAATRGVSPECSPRPVSPWPAGREHGCWGTLGADGGAARWPRSGSRSRIQGPNRVPLLGAGRPPEAPARAADAAADRALRSAA